MKISYNWIGELLQHSLTAEEMAEHLTATGLEVEGIHQVESIPGGLKGVRIGEVKSCEPHPNADRLKVTKVDIGAEELLQIVCGASNVSSGQKVLVATIGTRLYQGEDSFEIKKSKLRGELSEGMICAEDELGLGDSHEGIMVLPADAEVGMAAAEYFSLEGDQQLEIGLTPNRTDAMSHFGVARDLRAALLRHNIECGVLHLPSVASFSVTSQDLPIAIEIEDTEACARYAGLSLKNVKVGPSPEWLQKRLQTIGIGPINNVVDITNYVMHECGHPLHAFDVARIEGNTIVVKKARSGEKFVTLDGKERELHPEDLMICNAREPMVIAGIFGGKKSGVSENTTDIFLESAYFNPVNIRKTAKRHGLNTDASFRYERGVDPDMTLYALKRAAILIRDIAGGEIAMAINDVHPVKINGAEVELNLTRMNQLIGSEIPLALVREILKALDIQIKSEYGENMLLQVPAYRVDVTREADVVEEILRIYGFNSLPLHEKMAISVAPTQRRSERVYRENISSRLSARGFTEIMNNSLGKSSWFEKYGFQAGQSIEILNPLSQDLNAMRQSLLFGGLESISRNSNRQQPDLKLYEFGKIYRQLEGNFQEENQLGIWISGLEKPEGWKEGRITADFFSLRAEVDGILTNLGFTDLAEEESDVAFLEYGQKLMLNQREVATIGKLHSRLQSEMEIKPQVFVALLNWDYLTKKAAKNRVVFSELPKYPSVRRDLALLLERDVRYTDLKQEAMKREKKLLRQVNLFDVYEGDKLPEGKKSYALSFVLRDDSGTLNEQQVEKAMDNILAGIKKNFGAELR